MHNPIVSIIIRTKNEEQWITPCLNMVFGQTYKNLEVVIVDNMSVDRTIDRAKQFNCIFVNINSYVPGRALNDGIRASTGSVIVCLSAHCIPVNERWLSELIAPLEDSEVAGVYGRQEPLPFSSDQDKRDLLTVFGLDKKVQIKEPFFHNANSALLRKTWDQFPFDEGVSNLEDRVWGQGVVLAGKKIVYTPDASVFHWHGIHQDGNEERAKGVVRVLELIHGVSEIPEVISPSSQRSIAIIPIRGEKDNDSQSELLLSTIMDAQKSQYLRGIVVVTDSQDLFDVAQGHGALAIMRPESLSAPGLEVFDVLIFALEQYDQTNELVDIVVVLEATYPFRPFGIIDHLIEELVTSGVGTVIAGRKELRGMWKWSAGVVSEIGEGFKQRSLKSEAFYIGLFGLGCATRVSNLRTGDFLRLNLGILEVTDPLCSIEVRSPKDFESLKSLSARKLIEFSDVLKTKN